MGNMSNLAMPAIAEADPFGFLATLNFYESLAVYCEEIQRRGLFDEATKFRRRYRTRVGVEVNERDAVRRQVRELIAQGALCISK